MKRIIYSCIFFISLFITSNLHAQAWTPTISAGACKYPAVNYFGTVGNVVNNVAATSYTFSMQDPGGNPVFNAFTIIPGTPIPGEQATFTITGNCGVYTITMFALVGLNIIDQRVLQVTLSCPPTLTVSPSTSICVGSAANLTVAGTPPLVTTLWQPGGVNGTPFVATPTVNTCYTVTGTTAPGCTATAVTCVSVQNIGVTVTPQSQTVCPTTTVTLTANAVPPGVTYQWFQLTPFAALGTASTQTVSGGGSYSVNTSFNGCLASTTTSVVIGPTLSILVSAVNPSVCPFETNTLTATSAATSYTWFGMGFAPSFSATGSPTFPIGPGTYTVNGRNGLCVGTQTITIGQTVLNASIVATPTSVCAGESLTVTGNTGAAGTYTWGFLPPPFIGFPTQIPNGGTNSITVTQTVTTAYGYFFSTATGCTVTTIFPPAANATVTLNPPLTVTATASSASVCAGSQVTLTASGASSYTWVSPTGTIATTQTVATNPLVATTYSVYGANASGYCMSTVPGTVLVNMTQGGSITVTLSANVGTVCPLQAVNLTATTSLMGVNFSWTPTLTLNSTTGASVIAAPTTTTTYTVVADNGSGCTGTASITINVTPVPTVVAVASPSMVCAGYTSTLSASGAASYTWTGSTLIQPVFQPNVAVSPGTTLNPVATYTVVGAPANGNCLSAPVYVNVTLAPDLFIQASAIANTYTTCITTNASPLQPFKLSKPIDLQASGATTYNWFPNTPAFMTYSTGPQTTVRPPTSTCYTVIGSTQNCSGSTTLCVTVIPQFTMNVVPLSPVMCIGDSITMSIANIGTLAAGPANEFSYDWAEAANAPPPSLNFYGTPTVTGYPQNTTTYTVEMRDALQCVSLPRLTTVTVLPVPLTSIAIPTINNVPTNTICFVGDIPGAPDVYLDLSASNGNAGLPAGIVPTYTWDSPYTPESFLTNRNAPSVQIKAPSRTPSIVIYTVVTGYNGVKGCKAIDTVHVRVIDCRPIIRSNVRFDTDVLNDILCARECITFIAQTDTMAGGPQTYSWTFEGGSPATSTLQTPVVCYNLNGSFDVTLRVSNPYPKYVLPTPGSTATVAFRKYITVVDIPNVTIVAPGQQASDTTIRYGQSITLTGTNAITYNWSPAYNISSTTGTNVTITPLKTTQYILTGYNSNRCYASDTLNVIVIDDCGDMYIPNAFSPNGDGVNDELKVNGLCLETLTCMIFNRWGEKVFETNDVNVGWDGTFNGDKLNTGVFVYRLEGKTREGKGFTSKGNITLVR